MNRQNIILVTGYPGLPVAIARAGWLLVTFLTGCATEYNIATGREETILYSTEKEINIGRSIAKKVDKEYTIIEDMELNERLNRIGDSIVEVCDRREIKYYFKIIKEKEEEKEINAFALPGGFIYVNNSLIEAVHNDDELAGVLAHEIGHIVAKHSIKKLQAVMGYMLIRLATVAAGQPGIGQGADLAFGQIMLGYSREDEILADKLAAKYMELAGYNPETMIDFLRYIREVNRKKPLRPFSYNRTHPYISERITAIKREIGLPLDVEDVINISE